MFDKIIKRHDKMEMLDGIVNQLLLTRTVSMETADLINQIVPGEISSIDDEFVFELDEDENGFPLALEAGEAGLSKMKIAIIVAIIAFIAKYITSLNSGYSFSASGGGGGGWGGSAPPKFTTNSSPTSPEFTEEVNNYKKLLSEDIKNLNEKFKEAVNDLYTDANSETLTGLVNVKDMDKLINTISKLIKDNGNGATPSSNNSNIFADSSDVTLAAAAYNVYIGDDVQTNEETISKLQPVLKYIGDNYIPSKVFDSYVVKNEPGGSLAFLGNFGIPFFVSDENTTAITLEFIKLLNGLITNTDKFEEVLTSFEDAFSLEAGEETKPLDGSMPKENKTKLSDWIENNLSSKTSFNTTIAGAIIDNVIKVIAKLGDKIKVDNVINKEGDIYDVRAVLTATKSFISYTIKGPVSVTAEGTDKIKSVGDLLWDNNHSKLKDIMTKVVNPEINKLAEELTDNETDIERFTKTCTDLSTKYRFSGDVEDTSNVKRRILNQVDALREFLLILLAASAKYNIEVNKYGKNSVEVVIGKGQEIASNYAKLIESLTAVRKAAVGV